MTDSDSDRDDSSRSYRSEKDVGEEEEEENEYLQQRNLRVAELRARMLPLEEAAKSL